jgi:hypothetical protein
MLTILGFEIKAGKNAQRVKKSLLSKVKKSLLSGRQT